MRVRRLAPASAGDLREGLLADPGALAEGLRWLATDVPVPGQDPVDALGVDGRGRLVLVGFAAAADAASIERALGQWHWLLGAIPAIRTLAPPGGVDLAAEPRLALASARVSPAALHLAACIDRPRIELFEVALVSDGQRRGILVEEAGRARESHVASDGPRRDDARPTASEGRSMPVESGPLPTATVEPVELTPEEIAEFRKLGAERQPGTLAAGTKFVEN